MVVRKLINHPGAKCHIFCSDTDRIAPLQFYSYSTLVIHVDDDGWLTVRGLYSSTTRRQISWFLNEFYPFLSYYDVKRLYEKNQRFNVWSGEIALIE